MPVDMSLLLGIATTAVGIAIVVYWADMFGSDIPAKAIFISAPILLVFTTLYNMFAPEKLWTITFIVCLAITTVTVALHWIRLLIDKWKS